MTYNVSSGTLSLYTTTALTDNLTRNNNEKIHTKTKHEHKPITINLSWWEGLPTRDRDVAGSIPCRASLCSNLVCSVTKQCNLLPV